MPEPAPAIIIGLEQQLYRSQRFLRLYFSLGGGLLMLGAAAGLDSLQPAASGIAGNPPVQLVLFTFGSLIGYLCGGLLLATAVPRICAHVQMILVDSFLLPQLFDEGLFQQQLKIRTSAVGMVQAPALQQSMAQRLNWIVNNWSLIITRLGYSPLPPGVAALHLCYLALIVAVPTTAILLQSWLLLLVLGSVYILGLALDAMECDAVRIVLLDVLRSSGSAKYYKARR